MNGSRALQIFDGFRRGQLSFDAKEIDELIKLGLVIEGDPRDVELLGQLEPILRAAEIAINDPEAPQKVVARLAELEDKLKSSWSRLTTRDSKVKAQETERRQLRRALAVLNDTVARQRLLEVGFAPRATPWYACAALGDEIYALTEKGGRVEQALALRGERYGEHPLTAFLKGFDKTEAKMAAFSGEIATISRSIGYVKKNPHQVVIGLAKTGLPPVDALHTYHANVRAVRAPDLAVTYARNAGQHGGTQQVAERLRAAQRALREYGFVESPEVMGAAKTLLPFEPLSAGADRFRAIFNGVSASGFAGGDFGTAVKCTARLMPADGAPAQVVQRVNTTFGLLRRHPGMPAAHEGMQATALASLARDEGQLEGLVLRFREIEVALIEAGVCRRATASEYAIECVSAPGTPREVANTVHTLARQVASQCGHDQPTTADVAVAASFAKRFAF